MTSAATDSVFGLSSEEARRALERFGPNLLFAPAKPSFLKIAGEEITEPMILLLLTVGFFYGLWGSFGDTLTIIAVILVLVLVEVGNEFRAKRAIAALGEIAAPRARVLRDGKSVLIDAQSVVPGDVLVLTVGTRLAGDGRVTRSVNLALDESALTGESFPQEKATQQEVFAGSVVIAGEGTAQATATGAHTRVGQMGRQLGNLRPPKTPLQLAMKSLAGKLVWVAVGVSAAIALIGIARGADFRQMVLTGLALAFATIPEELPIIVAMVLGLGSYVLSKHNFLVKRIRATETLGRATVILTDKTGTLTESRMRVASVHPQTAKAEVVADAIAAAPLYSTNPIDQALLECAQETSSGPRSDRILRFREVGEGRRSRAVIRSLESRVAESESRLHVSGAPEEVFALCRSVPSEARQAVAAETALGRRVVAVATRLLAPSETKAAWADIERDLDLSGLVSVTDPPRPGVRDTIAQLASAGIRTVMVTGDHPATAAAIAQDVGIAAERVFTGSELDDLNDDELAEIAGKVSVYARALPQHKLRLVQALQNQGETVAVTGDGINDALALKAADVGIAMGIKGTDVAKEAAGVVLADDNYVTISRGVFEGRKLSDNLRKSVKYYLSLKVALVSIFLVPILLAIPLPFSPIQIVLLELFMDLGACAGFVAEPAEPIVFAARPRHAKATLIDRGALSAILIHGGLLFLAVAAVYLISWGRDREPQTLQTCALVGWIVGSVVLAFISRSEETVFHRGLLCNQVLDLWAIGNFAFLIAVVAWPYLRTRLHFGGITPAEFASSAAVAALAVSFAELTKLERLIHARTARVKTMIQNEKQPTLSRS